MALTYSVQEELGKPAPDFSLQGVDGKTYSLASFKDRRALAVVFMCNHCPYVQAVRDRINALARDYGPRGVGLIGINPNDPVKYPDDDFESMKLEAKRLGFVFPYVQDVTQEVAKAYGAVCTPDPYVYERDAKGQLVLRYHGRIDDNWKEEAKVTHHELKEAVENLVSGKPVAVKQYPAMGCSIKWR